MSASPKSSPEPTPLENEDKNQASTSASPEPTPAAHSWQAIFSPQHNAYYFYNSVTAETTWVNPLQAPEAASSSSTSSSTSPPTETASPKPAPHASPAPEPTPGPTSHYAALQAAALAQGIDPALAHLDPSLLSSLPSTSSFSSSSALPSSTPLFTAKFNRHTGAFSRPDALDPSHLSEHERAKRMSEFYFDVGKWEEDLAKQGGSIKGGAEDEWEDDGNGGRKRKRPTKKDLERFKEQKKQKKLAKTAWLRM